MQIKIAFINDRPTVRVAFSSWGLESKNRMYRIRKIFHLFPRTLLLHRPWLTRWGMIINPARKSVRKMFWLVLVTNYVTASVELWIVNARFLESPHNDFSSFQLLLTPNKFHQSSFHLHYGNEIWHSVLVTKVGGAGRISTQDGLS